MYIFIYIYGKKYRLIDKRQTIFFYLNPYQYSHLLLKRAPLFTCKF